MNIKKNISKYINITENIRKISCVKISNVKISVALDPSLEMAAGTFPMASAIDVWAGSAGGQVFTLAKRKIPYQIATAACSCHFCSRPASSCFTSLFRISLERYEKTTSMSM